MILSVTCKGSQPCNLFRDAFLKCIESWPQTQWNYLDKPSHRCTHEPRPNTTTCIAEFVQSRVKCNLNILGGNSEFENANCSREQRKELGGDSTDLKTDENPRKILMKVLLLYIKKSVQSLSQR